MSKRVFLTLNATAFKCSICVAVYSGNRYNVAAILCLETINGHHGEFISAFFCGHPRKLSPYWHILYSIGPDLLKLNLLVVSAMQYWLFETGYVKTDY